MTTVAYYADLSDVTLVLTDKGTPASWVHALPGGTYQHPVYGEMVFSDDRIHNFADSITKKLRGVDPDIDYDHKQDASKGNKAAGWVKTAESRPTGANGEKDLWIFVEWTPEGARSIKEKEFRYFSSEINDEWEDAKGNKFKDVFFGGGITNRPYMKNLVPVNLSDLTFGSPAQDDKGEQVDPKELRRKLGLAETATDAEVDLKLSEAAKRQDPKPTSDPLDGLAKLAETNPTIKSFMDMMKTQTEQFNAMQAQLALSETMRKLSELTGPDVKVQLSAAVLNDVRDVLVGAPQQLSDKVFSILKNIAGGSGVVVLGETGSTGSAEKNDGREDSNGATDKFNAAVEELMKNDKLSYVDAVERTAKTKPQLYAEYRKASYIPAEA